MMNGAINGAENSMFLCAKIIGMPNVSSHSMIDSGFWDVVVRIIYFGILGVVEFAILDANVEGRTSFS